MLKYHPYHFCVQNKAQSDLLLGTDFGDRALFILRLFPYGILWLDGDAHHGATVDTVTKKH